MAANTTPTFRRGGNAAEEADKAAAKAARSRGKGPDYFRLKDDRDTAVIRPYTDHDDWIWVEQHSFVPTKPAPKGAENWPDSMTSVCRHDKAFTGVYTDCYVCDNKLKNRFGKLARPAIRIWALAVERELVRGDGSPELGGPAKEGVVVGVRDKIDEIEETDENGNATGTVLRFPRILIVNMPMKGFFANLKALYGLYGTVTDRDFVVTRDGTGTDTNYRITALDPIADVRPGTPAWERYTQAVNEREINLEAIVADKASDAYYARFFDVAKQVDEDGNVVAAGSAPAAPAAGGMQAFAAPAAPAAYSPDLQERIRSLGVPSQG